MCGWCANAALTALLLPAVAAAVPSLPPGSLRGPPDGNRKASGVAATASGSSGGRQLTTASVKRSLLAEGQGCHEITRRVCCAFVDSRADRPEYFNQPCVPARDGSTFTDGSECQPACWTEGTCGSGFFQGSIALQCMDKYVLLRPGQACDAEGLLPISGDQESPAECMGPAKKFVALGSDVSQIFETDESTSGGCYYFPDSNSLTFNFGSPSPKGDPSRQYLCIRRKAEESLIPDGGGCYQLSRRACCGSSDNRVDHPEYFDQPCVPVRDGSTFTDGSECQPACWTEGTCGSGFFQGSIALQCRDKYVLLRPGQTCDAEGLLPISGDQESPAECIGPAKKFVALGSDLSQSYETDESTSGGCYYSPDSNSLTFNFGSPSPKGDPSRQYLCIRRKAEESLIPDGGGCNQLSRRACCGSSDNRVDHPEYFDQPCVPARSYSTFSDGTECQPACWVEGTCVSGSPQVAVSQQCTDKYVLLRPGQTCDAEGLLSISGDRQESPAECIGPAKKLVALRGDLSQSYETDESTSGGCYYSPDSNSLTFNFASPSLKGSPSRQYLCIRRPKERTPVPNGGGCQQSSRSLCCLYSDNRADLTEYFDQPCVPAAGLSTFNDGTECQPACSTEATCGSEVSQGSLSQQCAHKYVLLSPGETCDTAGLLPISGHGDEVAECFFVAPKFVAQWSNASLDFDTEESMSGGCYYSAGSNTLTFSRASPSLTGSLSRRYLCIRAP